MTNYIKNSIVLLLLILGNTNYSQIRTLDSLIQIIDNKDAYIVLLKTLSPRINSNAGAKLLKLENLQLLN